MSNSCKPRIKRSSGPSGITEHNYRRKAMAALLVDFQSRCAYSRRHIRLSGTTAMHVDHVNPRLRGKQRHQFRNLVLATAQCNGRKSAHWPDKEMLARDIRFLDPCSEQDYGVHIFENPDTNHLVAASPAGQYHIDMLDLNAETFVWERRVRAAYRKLSSATAVRVVGSFNNVPEMYRSVMQVVTGAIDDLIPPIPPPP